MNNSKNKQRLLAVLGILFVIVTVVCLALPVKKGPVFWLSYVFAVVAIITQLYAYPKAFDGKNARSKFYGFPIARVSTIYLIAQLALSLIFIVVGQWIPIWLPVVIFVLLLGAAAIGFISADAMRDEVERQDASLKTDTQSMRALQSRASTMAARCEDPEAKAGLQKLAEAFQFSDPVSNSSTEAVEHDLSVFLDEIQSALVEQDFHNVNDLCRKVAPVLAERNRLCKLNK